MKITVEFYTKIKHRKETHRIDHLRLLWTKTYKMPTKPRLSTIVKIDGDDFKVVKYGTSYRGKIQKHIIGVVKCQQD